MQHEKKNSYTLPRYSQEFPSDFSSIKSISVQMHENANLEREEETEFQRYVLLFKFYRLNTIYRKFKRNAKRIEK